MPEMDNQDNQLIAEFTAQRSEAAFAALVRQHVNLVYATAMRQVGDSGAAEEITQNVFIALAQASGKLESHPTIAGWLHRTTLNKSREWLRSELRRHHREQVAVERGLAALEGNSVWSPLVPLLDEALLGLREADRQAVILHFMEGQTFQEVGSTLGVGEDAVRKRVSRCLDQLTHFFRRRGFDVPMAVGSPLFALSLHSAPAGLAASATTAGFAHSVALTSTPTLIKGALKFMAWTKTKTAIIVGVAALLTVGTGVVAHHTVRVIQTRAALDKMQGDWEGTLQAGPGQIRLVFKIVKTNDTFYTTMDSVDQGAKDIPVPWVRATSHSIHLAQPALDADYQATLNPDGTELSGTFSQLKKTYPLTLTRTATPDAVVTITADQAVPRQNSDLQGQWQGTLAPGGVTLRLNLRIAETSPGTFQAQMDSIDQGAMNIPVTTFTYQKPDIHFEMMSINGDFAGKLNNADDRIAGTWKQAGRKWPLTFARMQTNADVTAATQGDYGSGVSYQIQGHWKGVLSLNGMQLRIVFNIALMPDGSYSATLDSPDQGAAGIPASSTECAFPNAKLSWNAIGGVFTGKVSNAKLSGTWRQGNMSFPLDLQKDTAP